MKENNLKPCPFCGGEGMLVENRIQGGTDYSFVKCKNCEAKTVNYYVSLKHCPNDEATKAWNRRADEEPRIEGELKSIFRFAERKWFGYCSVCGIELSGLSEIDLICCNRYCRNCGAKMKGGAE